MASASGEILYGAGLPVGKSKSIAERDYFKKLRDGAATGPIISDPVIGVLSGKRIIVLARRINRPDGSFGGVIYASVLTDVIADVFSSLNLGREGSVSLRKGFDDFAIIVRYPENIPGTTINAAGNPRHSPEFAAFVARGDKSHVYEAVTGVDGIYRTWSVRRLDKFNYYLGLGLAHGDVFAGWRIETAIWLAISGIFMMMTLIFADQQYKALRRQQQSFHLLESMATLDGLTEIPNRRSFNAALERAWLLAQREKRPISLVMLDIDHFKSFNDHYGHGQGDACLTAVAKSLKECINRPTDMVARFGGEEFVMLLENTTAKGAYKVAERARYVIESLRLPHKHSSISSWVTVSAGVFTMIPERDEAPSILIEKADMLLYQAKNSGRNSICGLDGMASNQDICHIQPQHT